LSVGYPTDEELYSFEEQPIPVTLQCSWAAVHDALQPSILPL